MTKSKKPVERDFNVFVGAETGILKGVSQPQSQSFQELPQSKGAAKVRRDYGTQLE